ncbi:MAG: 50S ribosomal protein L32e [Candidatus Bathyarchaeota archaeon]|nr:50S ribosomal protein L32e [Candidatus Bathyarchaeota archaeon]
MLKESNNIRRKKVLRKILKLKRKIPRFVRQESWRYKRLETGWRRPKGLDSKMRLKRKGYNPLPSIGHRTPKAFRGIHPSGYIEVLVHNPAELENLDPKIHAIRVAHVVGRRKRLEIEKVATEKGITILNPLKTG